MSTPFLDKLGRWEALTQQLSMIKQQELDLHRELFGEAFPAPVEGTNTFDLPDGYKLKGTHKIDRKVDLAAYNQLLPTLHEKQLPVDILLRWQPDLVIAEYHKLNVEALHLFDQVLIIKPSETPSLEVVLPAEE